MIRVATASSGYPMYTFVVEGLPEAFASVALAFDASRGARVHVMCVATGHRCRVLRP